MKTHKVEVTYEFITDLIAFVIIILLVSAFIHYGVIYAVTSNHKKEQVLYEQIVELVKEQNVQIKKLENLAVCPKIDELRKLDKLDELKKLEKLDELKCKRCVTF